MVLVERAAEFLRRAVVTIRAGQIEFGKKLVAVVFQLDALLFGIQARLQKVGPHGHALAPTVLHIEQLQRRVGDYCRGLNVHVMPA